MITFTYRELLTAARTIPAGDTQGANSWLIRCAALLETHGSLQPHQRAYLYRMKTIWRRRAAGEDSRWMMWGSRPGNNLRKTPAVRVVTKPAEIVVSIPVPQREPVRLEPAPAQPKPVWAKYAR